MIVCVYVFIMLRPDHTLRVICIHYSHYYKGELELDFDVGCKSYIFGIRVGTGLNAAGCVNALIGAINRIVFGHSVLADTLLLNQKDGSKISLV